jgi:molybdopterin synthase sulfur carrier subunit
MAVSVVFLGPLSELAECDRLELPAPLDWAALLAQLPASLAERMEDERIRVAQDGELLPDRGGLSASDGTEIALLPPVSGG